MILIGDKVFSVKKSIIWKCSLKILSRLFMKSLKSIKIIRYSEENNHLPKVVNCNWDSVC